jgi:hypothetical protein
VNAEAEATADRRIVAGEREPLEKVLLAVTQEAMPCRLSSAILAEVAATAGERIRLPAPMAQVRRPAS